MPDTNIELDALLDQWEGGGIYWPETGGGLNLVTYSFPTSMPEDWADVESLGEELSFQAFSAAAQAATTLALQQFAEVSDLRFLNVTNFGTGFNTGQMEFMAYTMVTSTGEPLQGAAYGRHPDDNPDNSRDGDVRVNTSSDSWDQVQAGPSHGDRALQLLMHEIGHAINFDHPGGYDVGSFPPGSTDAEQYELGAEYIEDSYQYTLMSYFEEDNTGADWNGNHSDGLMLHDVWVTQQAYGVNHETRDGHTRYGYNATEAGHEMHDWSVNERPIYAIWDGGGTDWIDLSGSPFSAQLDLREGAFSNTHGMISNLAIAYGAEIENAVGTNSGDDITGNGLANRIYGGASTDDILGLGGNDRLYGESGYDTINGGTGNDTVYGGSGNDDMRGGSGHDLMLGQDGSDTLRGQWGQDRLYGGNNNDQVYGGFGNDTVHGGAGNDLLHGQSGDDLVIGSSGHDSMEGGSGDDTFLGGSGNDTANGGSGVDTARFISGEDWTVSLAGGYASTASETDDLTSIENVETGWGNDMVTGSGVDNVLDTGSGDDTLSGGLNDDHYLAGAGDDLLRVLHGDNTLNGGSGFDIVAYIVLGSVDVDLTLGGVQNVGPTNDILINIEGLSSSIGQDTLLGNAADNWLSSSAGNDVVDGRGGDDTILGGAGDDSLSGGSGNDDIDGGAGSDTIAGDSGHDTIDAGEGNDVVDAGSGSDNVNAGAGRDYVEGGTGNDRLSGGADDDQLRGDAGRDALSGDAGTDNLHGGDGNDVLDGGAGGDTLNGSFGLDTVSYASASSGVHASFADPSSNTGDAAGDSYIAVENLGGSAFDDVLEGDVRDNAIYGRSGDDTILGNDGDDRLFGSTGDDVMSGGDGDDFLRGGPGFDTMSGGAGADVFSFQPGLDTILVKARVSEKEASKGSNLIQDFEIGLDAVQIDVDLRFGFRDLDLSQVGRDTLVEVGSFQIVMENIAAEKLSAADFDFF